MLYSKIHLRPELCILLILLIVGCTGSGRTPVTPGATSEIPIIDADVPANSAGVHQLWGLWQFTADPNSQTLDIVQLRSANWHQNVLPFLEPPPLVKLTLESVEFSGPFTIEAGIGLIHPFSGLDEFTGFDVCGIVFTNGTYADFGDGIIIAGAGNTRLINPDGYTRWWNPLEFPHTPVYGYTDGLLGAPYSYAHYNCTINGYKYFCDELGMNEELSGIPLDSRGQFSAGKKNVRHYTIELGVTGLIFNYAVDACWHPPDGSAPWDIPDDFPEGANRSEPYRIEVTEVNNSLYYEDYPSGGGGTAQYLVDVYDWYWTSSNTLSVRSNCGIPAILDLTPVSTGDGYATFQVDIDGSLLNANGDLKLIFIGKSEEIGYQELLPGEPVCAYHVYPITIEDPTPDSGWGHTWGNKALTTAEGMALDDYGNIYVTGFFDAYGSDGVDFDPGPGVDKHYSNGYYDVCLSKFTQDGGFQWAKSWGGDEGEDIGYDAACDSAGNIYITGLFKGTVDFDPGPGVEWRISTNYESEYGPKPTKDIFLSKFDSDGLFQWVQTWGGRGCMSYGGEPDMGYGVEVDSSDFVYVIGVFNDVIDFDPGPGVDIHDGGSLSSRQAFLSKFDSNGIYQWGRSWGNMGGDEEPISIFIDDSDIYITGMFDDSTDFDPGPGTDSHGANGGNPDTFLTKFDINGDFQWARTWGGTHPSGDSGIGVTVDNSGDVLVAGVFTGTIDFNPGGGTEMHQSQGLGDAFISKFNSSGDFIWARTWGAQDGDHASSVAADGFGNVYVSSGFNYPVDFDPGSGTDEHIPSGMWDVALSKFSEDGDYSWTRTWGSTQLDCASGVLFKEVGQIFMCGRCYFPIDLDPGPSFDIHNTGPSGFLIKILPDGYW